MKKTLLLLSLVVVLVALVFFGLKIETSGDNVAQVFRTIQSESRKPVSTFDNLYEIEYYQWTADDEGVLPIDGNVIPFSETDKYKKFIASGGSMDDFAFVNQWGYPVNTKVSRKQTNFFRRLFRGGETSRSAWVDCQPNPDAQGYFKVFFRDIDDNTGLGYDDDDLGSGRINALCETLVEFSDLLGFESLAITPEILVETSETDVPQFVAAAGSIYPSGIDGLVDSLLYQHIIEGRDPSETGPDAILYTSFAPYQPGGTGLDTVEFDIDVPGYQACRIYTYNFKTIMRHETMHMLGVHTQLSYNSSVYGDFPEIPRYGRYDQYLYIGNDPGTVLVQLPEQIMNASPGNPIPEFISRDAWFRSSDYSDIPVYSEISGSNHAKLSHLDQSRTEDNREYTINFQVPYNVERTLHQDEKNILCELGYALTDGSCNPGDGPFQCNDGIDNNGDGLIDINDSSCDSPTDDSEDGVLSPEPEYEYDRYICNGDFEADPIEGPLEIIDAENPNDLFYCSNNMLLFNPYVGVPQWCRTMGNPDLAGNNLDLAMGMFNLPYKTTYGTSGQITYPPNESGSRVAMLRLRESDTYPHASQGIQTKLITKLETGAAYRLSLDLMAGSESITQGTPENITPIRLVVTTLDPHRFSVEGWDLSIIDAITPITEVDIAYPTDGMWHEFTTDFVAENNNQYMAFYITTDDHIGVKQKTLYLDNIALEKISDAEMQPTIDIAVTKEMQIIDDPRLGEDVPVWIVTIQNEGTETAHDIVLEDILPELTPYVDHIFTTTGTTATTYDPRTGEINISELDPVGAGDEVILYIQVQGDFDQCVSNTVTFLSAVEVDGNPNNNEYIALAALGCRATDTNQFEQKSQLMINILGEYGQEMRLGDTHSYVLLLKQFLNLFNTHPQLDATNVYTQQTADVIKDIEANLGQTVDGITDPQLIDVIKDSMKASYDGVTDTSVIILH